MAGMWGISLPRYFLKTILTFITLFVSDLSCPTLLAPSTHRLVEEYAGGLLMALQKQDGDIRPILSEEILRRCFSSLAVNAMPVRNEAANLLTST
jgi:hypothetical protein